MPAPHANRRQVTLIVYRAATDLAAKALFFAVTVVAARRLAPAAFGQFSLATTLGWMAAVVADFGLQLHLARAVAQRPHDAPQMLRRWLRVRMTTAIAATGAVALGAAALLEPRTALAFVLVTAAYAITGMAEFVFHVFRGLDRSDLESTLTIVQRSLTLVICLPVLWLAPQNLALLGAALIVPAAISFAAAWPIAARLAARQAGGAAAHAADMAIEAAAILPIGAGIVLSAVYFRVDLFLVELWCGLDAAGRYNAVFRLIEALRLFPAAAVAVIMPVLFTATTSREAVRAGGRLAAGAAVLSLALGLAAEPLIGAIYGPDFRSMAPVFRVLALAFPLMALNYVLTHQLIGWHGHRAYALTCAVALLVNLCGNAALLPVFGVVAAAWMTLVTETVVTAGCVLGLTAPGRAGTVAAARQAAAS